VVLYSGGPIRPSERREGPAAVPSCGLSPLQLTTAPRAKQQSMERGFGAIAWRREQSRPLSLSRPSTRTWRQQNAGSWPARIGDARPLPQCRRSRVPRRAPPAPSAARSGPAGAFRGGRGPVGPPGRPQRGRQEPHAPPGNQAPHGRPVPPRRPTSGNQAPPERPMPPPRPTPGSQAPQHPGTQSAPASPNRRGPR